MEAYEIGELIGNTGRIILGVYLGYKLSVWIISKKKSKER